MSNWKFLNENRCRIETPTVPPEYTSDDSFGFSGMFRFAIDGKNIRCVASDGMGWKHVSVSIEYDRRCPSWEIMCKVKDLFWDDNDVVIQYHPRKQDYVNFHHGCLHLWQPFDGKNSLPFPTPPSILVGPK
jgi:hypothetical protein